MGNAAKLKRERPGTIVAVGGCYAEAQRERLFELYPDVDVAFGPGSIPHLGEWLGAGGFRVPPRPLRIDERPLPRGLTPHRPRALPARGSTSPGWQSQCPHTPVPPPPRP